jgi:glucose-1-phosphate adenylyltransferase
MKSRPRVLALVMAGGQGSRLHPLTTERCKPSVPFNGKHRLVDFVLSNLVNSEIYAIYLLVQYKSQALIEHVRQTWTMTRFMPEHFVTIVPPQMHHGPHWFQGTADSVSQNLHLIESFQPDLVAVFGADHVYRMDLRCMVDFHLETNADVSIATLPMPLDDCGAFGVVDIDADQRVRGFDEKPEQPRPMPGRATHALASMGNYLFSAGVLVDELKRGHAEGENDFGRHILPAMLKDRRLMAYDFTTHVIPGMQSYEDPHYWRDVGTIDAYYAAHFDTLGAQPRFRMTNKNWPIYASPDQAESAQIEHGLIDHSSIGTGSVVNGARLDHTMLRRSVRVDPDAALEHCLVMDRSRIGHGARLRRAIVDEDNDVPPFEAIGFDPARDRQRFHVTDSGIVVVPARHFPARA